MQQNWNRFLKNARNIGCGATRGGNILGLIADSLQLVAYRKFNQTYILMKAQSYQDLILWQKAMDLAELIYKSTSGFPKEEIYGLTSQMRRSAVSIPSNIAEGRSRNTKGEFLQFLGISKGSLSELETQVLLSVRLNYLTVEQSEKILSLSSEVGKLITSFQLKLKN